MRTLTAALPGATHDVFVTRELLDADRTAGMELVRRDADLRSHAELAAVGELRRCVVQDDRAVDAGEKSLAAACASSVTIDSVCAEPYFSMCAIAALRRRRCAPR